MKVDIKAKQINQVINAETAHVANQQIQTPPPGAEPAPPELKVAAIEPPRLALPGDSWWASIKAALPDFADDFDALANLLGAAKLDIGSTLNKMRYIMEKVLHTLCTRHGISWGKAEPTLENMIGPVLAAGALDKDVGIHVRTVQTNTSPGSHFQPAPLAESHVRIAEAALREILDWFRPKFALAEGG